MKKLLTLLLLCLIGTFSIAQPYPPLQIFPSSGDFRGLKVRNTPNIPNPDSIFVMMDRDATGRWVGRMSINQLVRTNQFYNNPNWLLSLGWGKIEGAPTAFPTNRTNVAGLNSVLDSIVTVLNGKQPLGSYLVAESDPSVPLYAKSLTGFGVIKNGTDALYQPIGNYLTSFTELDPTVPAFAKSLTGVTALRNVTDPLYRPISYVPTSAEIATSLGYTPYNATTNPNGYITLSQVPAALVSSVNTKTGAVVINATDVGLGNVNNTSDADKPISSAVTNALANKQNTLTLTTTGTGAATLTGSTLNIPTPTTVRVFVSSVTVGQSRAQLNSTYPTANVGDMVLAPSILLGGAVYIKSGTTGGGTWQTISAPPTL